MSATVSAVKSSRIGAPNSHDRDCCPSSYSFLLPLRPPPPRCTHIHLEIRRHHHLRRPRSQNGRSSDRDEPKHMRGTAGGAERRCRRVLRASSSIAGADEWDVREEEGASISDHDEIAASGYVSSGNGTFVGGAGEGEEAAIGTDASPAIKAGGPQGMAEAFSISSRTAFGITAVIAFAALIVPFFMPSTVPWMPLKTRGLSYLTLLFGFYMAWNIGANDVANAMGTSVGSGALSLRQAVLTAAVLEFSGAFMVGSHVSQTMQKGILAVSMFEGRPSLLFAGMVSSLAAAGTWLQVASYFGWPVSTTHCIIGAMVGFGLVYGGVNAVYWTSLARVVSSWVVSPIMGAAVSFVVYLCIRMCVYSAPNPGQAAATAAPVAVFVGVAALSFSAFPAQSTAFLTVAQALGAGAIGALVMNTIIRRELGGLLGEFCAVAPGERKEPSQSAKSLRMPMSVGGPTGTQLKIVYSIFGYLQVLSACFMSFAHGANDVANAIGPISAALAILHGTALTADVGMPTDVLMWGGFGIVAGLLVWGYRVIATIGKKITELTPTRGFAAEFAAASVVVTASRLGLPISATHTLVGAVMGVGFARGLKSVRGEVVREIVASWLVTIPVGAVLAVIYTWIAKAIVPSIL